MPEELDTRDLPMAFMPSLAQAQDAMAEVLSEILYQDGLDQLPRIAKTLESIADSLIKLEEALVLLSNAAKPDSPSEAFKEALRQ